MMWVWVKVHREGEGRGGAIRMPGKLNANLGQTYVAERGRGECKYSYSTKRIRWGTWATQRWLQGCGYAVMEHMGVDRVGHNVLCKQFWGIGRRG